MSFILEFSIEANVGYFIRKYLGPSVSNMIKVVNHFQDAPVEGVFSIRTRVEK